MERPTERYLTVQHEAPAWLLDVLDAHGDDAERDEAADDSNAHELPLGFV